MTATIVTTVVLSLFPREICNVLTCLPCNCGTLALVVEVTDNASFVVHVARIFDRLSTTSYDLVRTIAQLVYVDGDVFYDISAAITVRLLRRVIGV